MALFMCSAWLITSLNGVLKDPWNFYNKFSESFGIHFYKVIEQREQVIGDPAMKNPSFESR